MSCYKNYSLVYSKLMFYHELGL